MPAYAWYLTGVKYFVRTFHVLTMAMPAKRTLYSLSVFSNENTPFMRFTHSSIVRTLAIVFDPVRSMNSPCLQAEALNPKGLKKTGLTRDLSLLLYIAGRCPAKKYL